MPRVEHPIPRRVRANIKAWFNGGPYPGDPIQDLIVLMSYVDNLKGPKGHVVVLTKSPRTHVTPPAKPEPVGD
jgi:hypothetical protein